MRSINKVHNNNNNNNNNIIIIIIIIIISACNSNHKIHDFYCFTGMIDDSVIFLFD